MAKCWRALIEAVGLCMHVRFKWVLNFWILIGGLVKCCNHNNELWDNIKIFSFYIIEKVLLACVCRGEFDGVISWNQCQIACCLS